MDWPVQPLVVAAAVRRHVAPPTLLHGGRVLLLRSALRVVADSSFLPYLFRVFGVAVHFFLGSEHDGDSGVRRVHTDMEYDKELTN